MYDGPEMLGYRIAECAWSPRDGVAAGRWLRPWFTRQQLLDSPLTIIVTFFDDGARWHAWTIACESTLLPGQYGLFPARDFDETETLGIMRDGLIGAYTSHSRALQTAIREAQSSGQHRYLFVLPSTHKDQVTLHDGSLSRPGGPRNANDARGFARVAYNSKFMEDGRLVVTSHALRGLRADMSALQRMRSEILWDYGQEYWVYHDALSPRFERSEVCAPPHATDQQVTTAQHTVQASASTLSSLSTTGISSFHSAYTKALDSVRAECDGMPHEASLRALLTFLGVSRGKQSSLRALEAVLSVEAFPSRFTVDEAAWRHFGASR